MHQRSAADRSERQAALLHISVLEAPQFVWSTTGIALARVAMVRADARGFAEHVVMYEGRGPRFDRDYAQAHVPEPQPHEQTAEQKAAGTKTVADNLDHQLELVRAAVAAMIAAAGSLDLGAWTTARRSADQALQQLAHLAKGAPAAAHDAIDPDVKEHLASAERLHVDAQQLIDHAPPAPQTAAPELGCRDALLAALPPDPPPAAWRDADFQAAADAVAAVCARQMTSSDIAAFRMIVSGHEDHVIARRFRRLGEERRRRLLGLLDKDDVKRSARAREAERRAEAAEQAGNGRAGVKAQPVSADVTPTARGEGDTRATEQSEARAPVQAGMSDVSGEPGALEGATRPVSAQVMPTAPGEHGTRATKQPVARAPVQARPVSADVTPTATEEDDTRATKRLEAPAPVQARPVSADATPATTEEDDTRATERLEARAPVQAGASDVSGDPRALEHATPREALGFAIAARVPGVSYEGTGRFLVATGERSVIATIQRVHTGVTRVRRDTDDTAVVEIPTGIDENELAAAVAAQLRALQLQAGLQHGTSAGAAPLPPDVRADMEHALGADFSGARVHRGDTAVVEIPTGIDEHELAAAVAAQVRALQLQAGPQHGTSAGGAPLPPDVRTDMEHALGADFSGVRVHQDGQAEAVGALAFTRGADIHFAPGRYDPHSSPGRQLLGHELTHVAQQAQGRVSPTRRINGQAANDDPALEQEADSKGALAASTTGGAALPSTPARPASSGSAQARSASSGPVQAKAAPAPDASVDGQPTSDVSSALTTAPIQRQRDENATAHQPLNAERYWSKYGARTLQTALQRAMAEVVFEIAAPGLSFPTSECGPFILKGFGWRMQDTAPHHVSQLLDTPLYELIDGVRALDDRDRGPDAFEPAIVSRIVERLGRGIHRAVARLALRYAKARSRLVSAAKVTGGPIEQGLGPIQMPTAPKSDPATGQPDPNTLGARTTIEHAVAESMCAGFVEFYPDRFPGIYDTAIPGEPRPVKLALERGRGDWLTVRVVEPASASAADVANALYGTPELAHLVVGSGDRYSYVFPPGRQLAEPYETEFRHHMAGDGASAVDELHARNTQDPVLGLEAALTDRRALDSAKASGAAPKGADAASAVQRLDILQSVIDSIASAAAPLGVAPVIAPLQARLEQRRTACARDPAEAMKWAAHASEQLTLVSDAKAGFDALTEQMIATGLPAVSTADGPELVGDVTASMQGPTRELAAAFAAAIAASEQLDIGRERLAIAKERLAAYPFDMADRMLAVIRKRIASTTSYATLTMKSYEAERMAALEAELTRTIAALRIAVVNGDGTAALELTTLHTQLSMLDLQSTIGSTLSAMNELSGELRTSESMDPDKARQAWIYDQLHAAMGEWTKLAADYDAFYKAGHARDPATLEMIRARLQALRSKTDLPVLVHELAMFAEDEGKRQRWINIGIMIGAALLAAASGGIASGAIGGIAGSIVGAGIESLTFTAITSTLHQDPSFGGFMAELTLNFATFVGLRAISGGAKFLAGGKVLTLPQKLGEMTVEGLWMVASAKAQEKIAEAFAHGGQVTPQSAASIFGQQMAISFASRVLVRVGGAFVQGVTGIEKLPEVQLALARRTEEEQLARQVLASGDGKLGERLVKLDTDVLKAEQRALERVHEVASNPAEAARHGITAEPGALARVAADAKGAAREVRDHEIAALMAHAEVKADHAVVEPAVYTELVVKHRAQGSTIVEGFDSAGQPHAKITPSLADGSLGKPFTLHQRLGEEVEKILAAKKLPNTAVIGDYLAKRADDRAAALADLRKVNTPAELDQLMKRTLGDDVVAARELATSGNANSGGDKYTQGDITDQIRAVRTHVTEPRFEDRAWRDAGPGQIIRVREGKSEISVPARELAHVEPDAAHQTPGRQIVRVEVLANTSGGPGSPIGEVQPRDNRPYGTRFDAPVDPPTWLRLHMADGSHVDWLSGSTPPRGFRFQITPNSHFRNYGFSGGHTRDAWTETMRLYGDKIRELPSERLAFTLPDRSAPIDVSIQPYEVRGVPDASGVARWTRVNYPKSIFEGVGVSSIVDFEVHMAPYVTTAFNARPTAQIVDIRVPVRSLAGDPLELQIRVARDLDVPGGRITSWWVSETGIDPRLRPAPSTTPPTAGGTGG